MLFDTLDYRQKKSYANKNQLSTNNRISITQDDTWPDVITKWTCIAAEPLYNP